MDLVLTSRRRRAAGGFSLIEVLVAAAILLVIALGTVPLFTRAMIANRSGSDSNRVANFTADRAEEFYQYPFGSEALTIAPGDTQRVYDEYFSKQDDRWQPGTAASAPTGKTPLWSRTTTIRQFNVNDLSMPLDGGALLGEVQIKEIVVSVQAIRASGNPLGPGKRLAVRVYKAE